MTFSFIFIVYSRSPIQVNGSAPQIKPFSRFFPQSSSSSSTAARHALIKRRLALFQRLSHTEYSFDDVWLYLRGRRGGFTDEDVDRLITDSEKPFTIFDTERSRTLYREMRAMPDVLIRRVRVSFFPSGLNLIRMQTAPPKRAKRARDDSSDDDDEGEGDPPRNARSRSRSRSPARQRDESPRYSPSSPHLLPLRAAPAPQFTPPRQIRPALLAPPGAPQRAAPASRVTIDLNAEPYDNDDDDANADLQLAIELSMAPPLRTEEVMISDDDNDEPEPARAVKTCNVCQCDYPQETMMRVSFCCDHVFCKECILACFRSRPKPIVECPGCAAEHFLDCYHLPYIPIKAEGLIDPHFVRGIDGMANELKGGVQLKPFLRWDFPLTNAASPPTCPACSSFVPAATNATNPRVLRCWRPDCGMLFCRDCCRDWHGGQPCQVDAKVLADREFVRNNSRPCPRCSAPVVHSHGHGCHRIHCPSCSYIYCYVCSAIVIEGAHGLEEEEVSSCTCPIFCRPDCGCPPCLECKLDKPCANCNGTCKVCNPRPAH